MDLSSKLIRRHLEEQIISIVPIEQSFLDEGLRLLYGDCTEEQFLAERGWDHSDIDQYIRRPEALRRYGNQHFGPGIEEIFLAGKGARDVVIYSLLRVKDLALARELWIRLEEDEATFAEVARQYGEGPEADRQGVFGPVSMCSVQPPVLQEILRGLKAGEMSDPITLGEWHVLLRLEKLTPTPLDSTVREQMITEALNKFLDDRVNKILAGEGESLDPLYYDN